MKETETLSLRKEPYLPTSYWQKPLTSSSDNNPFIADDETNSPSFQLFLTTKPKTSNSEEPEITSGVSATLGSSTTEGSSITSTTGSSIGTNEAAYSSISAL